METCIFCRILERSSPARIVFEDDDILAFEDARPQAPVHILIVPRKHLASLKDAAPEDVPLLGRLLLVRIGTFCLLEIAPVESLNGKSMLASETFHKQVFPWLPRRAIEAPAVLKDELE